MRYKEGNRGVEVKYTTVCQEDASGAVVQWYGIDHVPLEVKNTLSTYIEKLIESFTGEEDVAYVTLQWLSSAISIALKREDCYCMEVIGELIFCMHGSMKVAIDIYEHMAKLKPKEGCVLVAKAQSSGEVKGNKDKH